MSKAVIFDLDGTLIDSLGDIHAALNDVLQLRNAPPLALATVRGFIGKGIGQSGDARPNGAEFAN